MDPHRHDERMANLARMQGQVDALLEQAAQRRAQPAELPPVAQGLLRRPLDPKDCDTTIAQVRRMVQKDMYPTWFHAAYAHLAQRLARVEALLEDLSDSMSLLHTKTETLIGQLAAVERQDWGTDNGRDA